MKKYLILVIVALLVTGCSNRDDKLIMATEAAFAPYEYYSNGEIKGVDVDIMKAVAKKMNKELKVKDVAFDSIIAEVKTHKSDVGAAGISYTEERAKQVDFSIPYVESKQVIVVKKNSKITGPEDLKNIKVAVQLGTVADSVLSDEYESVQLVREKKFMAAIQDLKDNKVTAVVMDELPASRLIDNNLKILEKAVTVDSYSVIVDKGNTELLEIINGVIQELKDEGEIDRYLLKHIGE
ncbi:MAG: transporter substrate-binding domain-containing protein [Bacilli bacterium]|nr:transporter substrate-binding domain-containing protein [Bacilli bacterium]